MESIRKQALQAYKNSLGSKLGYAFTYGFFVLLCFAISYFLPFFIILAIPFIIIPLTFGLQVCCANANNNIPYSLRALFYGFRMYFSSKAHGCYGLIQATLKFALGFLAVSSVTSIIIIPLYSYIDPGFNSLLLSINDASTLEEINEITVQLIEYGNYYLIQSSVSLFGGLYLFFHHIMSTSIRGAMALYTPTPIDMGSNKLMHKVAFKTFRKQYYKDYYASNWFFILIGLIGFVGGLFLCNYIVSTTEVVMLPEQMQTIAVAIPFLIALPFLPLFFDSIELLYKRHSKDYQNASIRGVMDNIDQILNDKSLTDEEKAALNQFVKEQEELKKSKEQPAEDKSPVESNVDSKEEQKNTDESV